jgi:hypothetical protein
MDGWMDGRTDRQTDREIDRILGKYKLRNSAVRSLGRSRRGWEDIIEVDPKYL